MVHAGAGRVSWGGVGGAKSFFPCRNAHQVKADTQFQHARFCREAIQRQNIKLQVQKRRCTSRGSCNRTLLTRVLRRFSNCKCFLKGFFKGACKGFQ